jgi:hypothetical protein
LKGKGLLRNVIVVLSVAVSALILVGCEPVETESDVLFYVAIHGDDANIGTIDKPFRTLQGARDTVRQL